MSSGGVTTTTTYIGRVEELRTTSGTTTTTIYYYAGDQRVALAVNGTFSYLGTDGLGSASVALDGSGQRACECALRAVWGGALWSREGILIAQPRRNAVMPPLTWHLTCCTRSTSR